MYSQEKAIETSGDILLYAMPAISLGSTLIIGDKQGSWQFLKGLAVNEAMTFGLKLAITKPRPNEANNNSFPSGHTSTTFQSAAFIQKRYGWKYGIPAYTLAAFTGYSRIYADQHDILDVLVGAAIGVGSSYLFTNEYRKERMEITFTSNRDNILLGFNYKF
ncbi:phosphatase PAP2 family protein [Galbibacter pacificus]|uniref:Phosphatase PAP2 family protein n=1 Tax=Galbibacter pacificus TaxID=2996052 RepID=A0ABT6FWH3_9FLAO|nr:phosphatase PAP2 family protein [Galbibacter pacificus]MDG3583948.1 phosphatase PAP2 family protein [Galbibacter pacificus]MDG3587614.1 phosphatase PAP2 family protein [Galbibacter pacificus]